jgi:GntR family transcriptional regulator
MAGNDGGEGRRAAHFASEEVPLYYQLRTILRETILSGRYGAGEQIPTEVQLVQDYGVSRITVRQSLGMLEEEGLIRREVGRGTFVSDHLPPRPSLNMDGTLNDLISPGMASSIRLVDHRVTKATAEDAEDLRIRPGDPLVRCARLLYHSQEPYCLVVNLLPQAIGAKLTRRYLRKGSILQYVENTLGMKLREADQTVKAILADATLARILQTGIGSPLLLVHRLVRANDGTPVERVLAHFRGDLFSLSVHLAREKGRSRSVTGWSLVDPGKKRTR